MTTKPISFEGASDDIAYVTVDGRPDEYDAYEGANAQFHIISRSGQMQVTVALDDNSGCWGITVGQTDEAHPLPSWPVNVVQSKDTDYSSRLTVTAPHDAVLVVTG
ncbi:hypothetical protein [Rhodococcoides fascians]|uniref:hypothetical protein n=1 Tax=Rhodococcoides fascians TaxID=1828 RepID=UPI00068D8E1A|nr:hypothetical protein [Rhodococcus fascians]